MIRRPPRSTRTDTRFPYTTLCRSLAPGSHALCHGCRMPVSPADRLSPLYVEGVTCPACHEERDEERSEEHTSELQSLMRISYAVFCLKKKKITKQVTITIYLNADNYDVQTHMPTTNPKNQ